MAAQEVIDFLENGNIKNSVNMPAASMPRATQNRLCIIHKNMPSMVSQITTAMSDNGVNIESMINQSKKDYAYTMLDVSAPVSQEAIDKLNAADGIIRVWSL